MKVVLVHVTDRSLFIGENVVAHQSRGDACRYCINKIFGSDEKVKKIVEVDLTTNTITELKLQFGDAESDSYKFQLTEVKR